MMRRALPLLLLLWAAAALGQPRVKIDRYEPATLPEVRIWLSALDGTKPIREANLNSFSLFVNDGLKPIELVSESAAEAERPMAVAAVLDARRRSRWKATRKGLDAAFGALPKGSIAVAVVSHHKNQCLPKEGFTENPADLPESLEGVQYGGEKPRLYGAIRAALERFPLAPGLEQEASDGDLPPPRGKKDDPFPIDRILYIIGDGAMERVGRGRDPAVLTRELVLLARRRGVRVMSISVIDVDDEDDDAVDYSWVLRLLARKTGGTFRSVPTDADLSDALKQAAAELSRRFMLTAELEGLRRGDPMMLRVEMYLHRGGKVTSRTFSTQAEHVLSFWERVGDAISDFWEKAPWWVRSLIIFGVLLIVGIIAAVIIWRKLKKRRAARAEVEAAHQATLAARRPCPTCGQVMMADWTACLFCAQSAEPEAAKARFRLTGRSSHWAGHAVTFSTPTMTIGAERGCEVQVVDRGVAPQHCAIRDRGDSFILTDFNTESGTWLNDQRISQAPLNDGDRLRVGETEFLFEIEE